MRQMLLTCTRGRGMGQSSSSPGLWAEEKMASLRGVAGVRETQSLHHVPDNLISNISTTTQRTAPSVNSVPRTTPAARRCPTDDTSRVDDVPWAALMMFIVDNITVVQ
ncbi:hypothetical protein AAFF_G00196570 [Aldrovandia affinis]|uniref:Uncharacterized protein n=1 Tax=Aldrovandia affinis TaxID=143900 RepID=A0AAD7RIS9_9TELE|nr:hypothetical protein AAFF_G00196570 [Aldrovandia affinis]